MVKCFRTRSRLQFDPGRKRVYRAPARSLVAMESCGNSNTFQWEFATQNYGVDVTCRRSIIMLVRGWLFIEFQVRVEFGSSSS